MVTLKALGCRRTVDQVSRPRLAAQFVLLAFVLGLQNFAAAVAEAQGKELSRFFGEYRGTGVAEGAAEDFGISVRSLDVAIEAIRKGGFTVRWSALYRSGPENAPKYRLRLAEAAFMPTERDGIYRAVSSTREESGRWIGWARIRGDIMTIYQLLLEDGGSFQLTSHERTLTDTGMSLRFVRRRDSGVVRVVNGELEKTSG